MPIIGGCDNKECCVSMGICGALTFGSGELDEFGYWEKPCHKCARAYEKLEPKTDRRCWPFDKDKKEN